MDLRVRLVDRSRLSTIDSKKVSEIIEKKSYRIYPNIGIFYFYQGCEIVIDRAPGADERILRSLLLGQIFAAVLHQRGLLVLHGSAIAIDGGVAVFLGPSGSGKSTAAAVLGKKGNSVVADDVVAIDANGTVPIVYPAFPQFKLWPDAAEAIGYDTTYLRHAIPTEDKYLVPLEFGFSPNPLPLKRIYLLNQGDIIRIERLSQQESVIELVRNSKAVESLCIKENLSSHFIQCTKVARDVPVCRLTRPIDLDVLNNLANEVEKDARRE